MNTLTTKWQNALSRNMAAFVLMIFLLLVFGSETFASGLTPNSIMLACGGSNDTALLSAANSAGGTIIIPDQIICASNSQTISTSLDIQDGGRLKPITGQTVTLTGPQSGGVWQKFTNATAGLGTVSFAGNKVVTEVYPEWWGGGVGITAATNTAAIQAANDALITNGIGGEIKLGVGMYDINAKITLGNTSASSYTTISLGGIGSLLSGLTWTGATSGTVIEVNQGRNNNFHDFFLQNSVAKGTTIGMLMTGPGSGTQVIGATLTRVAIRGFSVNLQLGESGASASEFAAYSSLFEQGDKGVYIPEQNSTNINFYACQWNSNVSYAVYLLFGNVGVYGGSVVDTGAGSAGIADFYIANTTVYLSLNGVRTELNPGTMFVKSGASQSDAVINVLGCAVKTNSTITTPVLGGTGTWHITGNSFNLDKITLIFGDDPAVSPIVLTNGITNVTLADNTTYEGAKLISVSPYYSNMNGLRYSLTNNQKLDSSGTSTGRWQDEPNGRVVWPGRLSGEHLLEYKVAVDLNTATASTLFTNDTGRTIVITKVVLSNASTSLTTASISFGWTGAAYNDVIATATHTELTGSTLQTILFPKVGAKLGPSAGAFKVLANVLQGGAATCDIAVYGYFAS